MTSSSCSDRLPLIDHSTSHEMFSLVFALKLGWRFTQLPNFFTSARRFAEGGPCAVPTCVELCQMIFSVWMPKSNTDNIEIIIISNYIKGKGPFWNILWEAILITSEQRNIQIVVLNSKILYVESIRGQHNIFQ